MVNIIQRGAFYNTVTEYAARGVARRLGLPAEELSFHVSLARGVVPVTDAAGRRIAILKWESFGWKVCPL